MKVRFSLYFLGGEMDWYNKDHWQKFLPEDLMRCLIDFTEVKEFQCNFNEKERCWDVKATIPPMTIGNFEENMKAALLKYYKRSEVRIGVPEMKLEKKEIGQFTTALVMSNIEGK